MTVKQIQCLLTYLGYDPGAIDGVDGPKTQAALAAFRQDYGVGAEGLVGAVAGTVAKLEKPQQDTTGGSTGTFWDGIRYFKPDEPNICCPCPRCVGKKEYPTEKLMKTADSIREELGPMVPSSVRRCQEHNDELPGSAKNSYHTKGKAMDFACPRSSNAKVEDCLDRKKNTGEIRYWYHMGNGWYHFEIE